MSRYSLNISFHSETSPCTWPFDWRNIRGNRSLFSVEISAYFGQFHSKFRKLRFILLHTPTVLLWGMQWSRYMPLTVAPVHNSAGRQTRSPASNTCLQSVTQQQKTRMSLQVFQVSLGPRTTVTQRPVLINKSYEQGHSCGVGDGVDKWCCTTLQAAESKERRNGWWNKYCKWQILIFLPSKT